VVEEEREDEYPAAQEEGWESTGRGWHDAGCDACRCPDAAAGKWRAGEEEEEVDRTRSGALLTPVAGTHSQVLMSLEESNIWHGYKAVRVESHFALAPPFFAPNHARSDTLRRHFQALTRSKNEQG